MSLPNRRERVGRQVQKILSECFRQRCEPIFSDGFIVRVDMSRDLSHARVWLRSYQRPDEQRGDWIKALNQQATSLRREVTLALNIKRSPDLRFCYDEAGESYEQLQDDLSQVPD